MTDQRREHRDKRFAELDCLIAKMDREPVMSRREKEMTLAALARPRKGVL